MVSTNETGHQKNVANFDALIAFATGYGASYNPSKAALAIDALKALSDQAKDAINTVSTAEPAYKNAVAAREAAFAPLSKLTTRIINALKATDAAKQVVDDAKSVARKIQGTRAKAKLTDEQKKALAEQGKEVVEISTSQMSFDNRLDNLFKLTQLLASVPEYAPNETELKVDTLNRMMDDLKAKNAAVMDATTPLSNARITRNEILYKEDAGLYDVAADMKAYVKSVFGASSPQYRQVSKIKFTKSR